MKVTCLAATFLLSSLATAHASSGAPSPVRNTALATPDCLDVPGFATGDVALQGYPCNSGSNQMWTLTDAAIVNGVRYFTVQSSSSHKCMAVTSSSDFDAVLQTTCNAASVAQQWQLTTLPNGYYKLVNRMSGKCLDDGSWPECDADECRNEYLDGLQQYSCIDDAIQEWHLEANAIPVPPPGTLAISNQTQVSVLTAILGQFTLSLGIGIPTTQTATFSVNAATYAATLRIGFDANAPAAQVGRVVCTRSFTPTIASGATTTLTPAAFSAGEVLTHCGAAIAYNGGYTDLRGFHAAKITFLSDNTFTWTFDGVAQVGGSLSHFTWSSQLTNLQFNLNKDHVTIWFPYDVFSLNVNGHSVLFSRATTW
jgi:hypothetical protein